LAENQTEIRSPERNFTARSTSCFTFGQDLFGIAELIGKKIESRK
jgi:hypothetical protein